MPRPKADLEQIIAEREAWAKEAREKDLNGTAAEYELTVELAREVIELRKHYTPA